MRSACCLFIVLSLVLFGCGGGEKKGSEFFFGKDLKELTTEGGATPSWSPDGSRIAYVFAGDIWMIPAEGGTPTQLTSLPGQEAHPSWSHNPSDPTITFVCRTTSGFKIYTLNVETLDLKEIYSTKNDIDFACFTNDGKLIAFRGADKGYGIRLVSAQGDTVATKVNNSDGWERVVSIDCSPVEPIILYVEMRGTDYNIYTIPIEGGTPTKLTNYTDKPGAHHKIWYAAWSKDGTRIAFAHSGSTGTGGRTSAIYTMDSDGQNIKQWTIDPMTSHEDVILFEWPSFAPDNNRLACQHGGQIWILTLE